MTIIARMKKKTDPQQLELDFVTAKVHLIDAAEKFDIAAKAWSQSLMGEAPAAAPVIDMEQQMLRGTVRRLVGILVDQSGLPFHAAWVMAYHELHKATGYHPVVNGVRTCKQTFLDVVQAEGKLEELRDTVLKMLQDKEYGK